VLFGVFNFDWTINCYSSKSVLISLSILHFLNVEQMQGSQSILIFTNRLSYESNEFCMCINQCLNDLTEKKCNERKVVGKENFQILIK
jgi:hypothetical protein